MLPKRWSIFVFLSLMNQIMAESKIEISPITVCRDAYGTRITLRMFSCGYSFIIYELVRAFFFLLFAKKGRHAISFNKKGRFVFARCACNEYLSVWQQFVSALMPFFLLGFLPVCYALFSGRLTFLWVGIPFLVMGIPDYKLIYLLRFFNTKDKLLLQM